MRGALGVAPAEGFELRGLTASGVTAGLLVLAARSPHRTYAVTVVRALPERPAVSAAVRRVLASFAFSRPGRPSLHSANP
jgi:hypothetical protein